MEWHVQIGFLRSIAPNLLLIWAGELHNLEDPYRIPRSCRLFLIVIWCYFFVVIFGGINVSSYWHPLLCETGCSFVTFLKYLFLPFHYSTISFPPEIRAFTIRINSFFWFFGSKSPISTLLKMFRDRFFRQQTCKCIKKRKKLKNHNHLNMAKQKMRKILSVLVIQWLICATPLNLEFI